MKRHHTMRKRKLAGLGIVMAGAVAWTLCLGAVDAAAQTELSKADIEDAIEDAKEGLAPVKPLAGAAGAMLGAGACGLVAPPAVGLCAITGGAIGASVGAIATHRAERVLDRIANQPSPPLYGEEWHPGDGVRLHPRRTRVRSPFVQSYNFPGGGGSGGGCKGDDNFLRESRESVILDCFGDRNW